MHAATVTASLHGFYSCFTVMAKRPLEPPQQDPPEPRLISSDALAHLMNIRGASGDLKPPVLIDVRRHDERTLFGCITGSVHIPAEDVATVVQSTSDMFEQIARTPVWAKEDAIVFHSRGTCRAQWAAVLAAQQGAHLFMPQMITLSSPNTRRQVSLLLPPAAISFFASSASLCCRICQCVCAVWRDK